MKFAATKKQLLVKQFEQTLKEYQEAARKSPEDIRSHIKIAELYLDNKYIDKAIEEYRYAANAYANKKLFQIAIAIYNHILSIDYNLTDVYNTLTQLYLQNGFRGDAVATLEKLAGYYYNNGLKSEAMQVLQHITEIDPSNEFFKLKVAQFFEIKDTDSKKPDQPAIPEIKENPPAQNEIIKEQTDTQSSAYYDLEAALQADQSFNFTPGSSSPDNGDQPAAEESIQKNSYNEIFSAIKQNVESEPEQKIPDFHYNLGIAYQHLGQFEEAIEEFENALLNDEKISECYLQLIKCSYALDRSDKAEEYRKQALSIKSLTKDEKRRIAKESGENGETHTKSALVGFVKKILHVT
jgi:tetratricopeptide (TPR) repeat protein